MTKLITFIDEQTLNCRENERKEGKECNDDGWVTLRER